MKLKYKDLINLGRKIATMVAHIEFLKRELLNEYLFHFRILNNFHKIYNEKELINFSKEDKGNFIKKIKISVVSINLSIKQTNNHLKQCGIPVKYELIKFGKIKEEVKSLFEPQIYRNEIRSLNSHLVNAVKSYLNNKFRYKEKELKLSFYFDNKLTNFRVPQVQKIKKDLESVVDLFLIGFYPEAIIVLSSTLENFIEKKIVENYKFIKTKFTKEEIKEKSLGALLDILKLNKLIHESEWLTLSKVRLSRNISTHKRKKRDIHLINSECESIIKLSFLIIPKIYNRFNNLTKTKS